MTMGERRYRPVLRAAIGGVLAGLAPGTGGVLVMLPALALLWSVAQRPWLGAFWGGLAVLVSHRWLLALHPLTWMGVPPLLSLPIAVLLWFICGLAAAVLLLVWTVLARGLRGQRSAWGPLEVLLLSALWGVVEVALARGPLFWIGLGGSVLPFDTLLAGLGRWIGSGGLAVVLLLLGWGLFQVVRLGRRRQWVVWLVGLLLVHGLGAVALVAAEPATGQLKLAVWQPAIPTREKFSDAQQRQLPAALRQALEQAQQFDAQALIAPEGTLPARGVGVIAGQPLPLISGGFRWVRGAQRSSLLLVNPGDSMGTPLLDKHRLVPLGESLPPLPAGLTAGLSAVGGLQPGPADRLFAGFQVPGAAAICYELSDGSALAGATAAGGQWLLTIANLDPYPMLLQRQFLALARLRAIETDRDLLSVANTGPTAVVRADGSFQRLLPPGEAGVSSASLLLRSAPTFYAQWRESPAVLILLLTGLILIRGRINNVENADDSS